MAITANKFTSANILPTRNTAFVKTVVDNSVINNSKGVLVGKFVSARILSDYVIELMANQGSATPPPTTGWIFPRGKA